MTAVEPAVGTPLQAVYHVVARLQAPAVVVLTGRWATPLRKYGERGYRVLLLDAGHLMENLLLTATALRLGTCPIAGFRDDRIAEILAVTQAEEPVLYSLLLGLPDIRQGSASEVRITPGVGGVSP